MKNKNVGFLLIGIALFIGVIVFLFNNALITIVSTSCTHGPSCPMYGTIKTQTYIATALIGLIILVGLFFIFSKPEEKIVVKKIKEKIEVKRKPIDYSKLDKDEKAIVRYIEEANGAIFQSELAEKTGFSKVKVTRILDRLEGRQIVERKRRGMTNVIVLKN